MSSGSLSRLFNCKTRSHQYFKFLVDCIFLSHNFIAFSLQLVTNLFLRLQCIVHFGKLDIKPTQRRQLKCIIWPSVQGTKVPCWDHQFGIQVRACDSWCTTGPPSCDGYLHNRSRKSKGARRGASRITPLCAVAIYGN